MRFLRPAVALSALSLTLATPCRADFSGLGAALGFVVLGQFSNNQTNFNNGTLTGDIGIGSPRQFTISNANLDGNVRFSGAANTSGLGGGAPCTVNGDPGTTNSGGGCFAGTVIANDPVVTSALNSANNYSQTLGGEAGTNVAISTGGSLTASSGALDGAGNRVFTVTSANFPNGTFTINGGAGDFVVLNIGFSVNLHGQILLAGGITQDHVLNNVFGGNNTTHTGGPTLDVNTNGLQTFGIFLDPNGGMSAVHTDIQGRFFGGDVQNQQIVSGANITATEVTPEPGSMALFATGLFGLAGVGVVRRRRR